MAKLSTMGGERVMVQTQSCPPLEQHASRWQPARRTVQLRAFLITPRLDLHLWVAAKGGGIR